MTIRLRTADRIDIVDVTTEVRESIPDEFERGLCTVFVPHTTAGVVVNEHETGLLTDLERALDRLVTEDGEYEHDAIDDNADAHLRSTLLGESASIPVVDRDLALGTWQAVLFVECDGPRTRSVEVVFTSEP